MYNNNDIKKRRCKDNASRWGPASQGMLGLEQSQKAVDDIRKVGRSSHAHLQKGELDLQQSGGLQAIVQYSTLLKGQTVEVALEDESHF